MKNEYIELSEMVNDVSPIAKLVYEIDQMQGLSERQKLKALWCGLQ